MNVLNLPEDIQAEIMERAVRSVLNELKYHPNHSNSLDAEFKDMLAIDRPDSRTRGFYRLYRKAKHTLNYDPYPNILFLK